MELKDPTSFDKYFWIARVFPSIIALIPFFIVQYLYFDNLIFIQLKNIENYSPILHAIILFLAIYVASVLVRGLGKDLIENLYFIRNNKFPTTQILLGTKRVVSQEQLTLLKSKIKRDFKINLTGKCRHDELLLRINDAVDKIRVRVGYESKILNQYNLEYGFFRNLTGGLIIFFLTDLLLIRFSKIYANPAIFRISLVMLLIGALFAIFSRVILDSCGTKYAKQLFSEYLAAKK